MELSYKPAGQFELTRFEKIHNVIFEFSHIASIVVAQEIADLIREKSKQNSHCVLGLATALATIFPTATLP